MMAQIPFMKLYPTDWRADANLRSCSPIARYVWIEMLMLMHEAEPRGHLVLAGRMIDARTLARLILVPVKDVNRALAELELRGVFSRDEAEIIVSRRQVREEVAASKGRANGRLGGSPVLKNQGLGGETARSGVNPGVKASRTCVPEARSQKLKASGEASGEASAPEPRRDGEKSDAEIGDRGLARPGGGTGDPGSAGTGAIEAAAAAGPAGRPAASRDVGRLVVAAMGRDWDDPRWIGDTGLVAQWLANGWDAELDILPTVRALSERKRQRSGDPPKALSYFTNAIAEAHRTRVAAGTSAAAVATADPACLWPGLKAAGWRRDDAKHLALLCKAWFRDHRWEEDWGPKPGQAGGFVEVGFVEAWRAKQLGAAP